MQEYRRRIAYLYAYEYGEKLGSGGFVKAEERGGRCRLRLCLKSSSLQETTGKVYIYFEHQRCPVGIYLGELKRQDDTLQWQGELDASDILGKGIRIADTKGVWVRCPQNRNYVAEWEDAPVDVSRFVLYPRGGQKCIRCPWFGNCERSREDAADRRGKVHEGGDPAGA